MRAVISTERRSGYLLLRLMCAQTALNNSLRASSSHDILVPHKNVNTTDYRGHFEFHISLKLKWVSILKSKVV